MSLLVYYMNILINPIKLNNRIFLINILDFFIILFFFLNIILENS